MAIEHDYFGVLTAGPDGSIFWTDEVEFGDHVVTVDLTAPDEDAVVAEALDLAAALITGIENIDMAARRAMLAEIDDRTSEVTEFVLQQQEELGEDLYDFLVDISGDDAVDIIRSLRMLTMTILADEHDGSDAFAVLEYLLDQDSDESTLLVNFSADGSVLSVVSSE
ncbi:DUF2004 domain-containing protein [Microbacterium sp. YY-01]|uniref:DUF2004 domain-containing protein n=1 Tax=Microbacterium sp. YY-01 TaxID=3421634 RepID=UPI003D16E9C7